MKKTFNTKNSWKFTQPFDSKHHSLVGFAALDLYKKEDLNTLAVRFINGYNPDRFDAMALRFFVQKNEPVIVLYSVDTYKLEDDNYPPDKLPVKKFRIRIPFDQLIRKIKRFDFTLSNDSYDIGDMLILNK
jgi:hypothetical protein